MDLNIKYLAKLHFLDKQAQNICLINGLNTLSLIITHFKKYKSFLNLKEIEKGTNQDLIQISLFYLGFDFMNPTSSIKDIFKTINPELYLKNMYFRIAKFEEFIESTKSEFEFLSKEMKVLHCMYSFSLNQKQVDLKRFENGNNSELYLYIRSLFGKKIESISKRSRNILEVILREVKNDPNKLFLYNSEYKILLFRNAGEKVVSELHPLIKSIIRSINFESINDPKYFAPTIKVLQLENDLGYKNSEINYWLESKGLTMNSEIPFFALLEYHIKFYFKDREYVLLFDYLNKFKSKNRIDKIPFAKRFSVTRERYRQLKAQVLSKYFECVRKLFNTLLKHDFVIPDYIKRYGTDNILLKTSEIKSREGTKLDESLLFKALEIINPDYSLIINNVKKMDFKFLIPNSLLKAINFKRLFDLIIEQKTKKIFNDLNINLTDLVSECLEKYRKISEIKEYLPGISKILLSQFDIKFNPKGNVLFKKNTSPKIYTFIIDLLKKMNRPLHIKEIAQEINNISTKSTQNLRKIRGQINKHREDFILTGASTYGLKEWEGRENIAIGTITSLIISFLDKFLEPKHVFNIYYEINKFRRTSEKNIMGLIQMNTLNNFIIFKSGFIGLARKKYSNPNSKINKLPSNWKKAFVKTYLSDGISKQTIELIVRKEKTKYNTLSELIEVNIERGKLNGNWRLTKDNRLRLLKQ